MLAKSFCKIIGLRANNTYKRAINNTQKKEILQKYPSPLLIRKNCLSDLTPKLLQPKLCPLGGDILKRHGLEKTVFQKTSIHKSPPECQIFITLDRQQLVVTVSRPHLAAKLQSGKLVSMDMRGWKTSRKTAGQQGGDENNPTEDEEGVARERSPKFC